MATRPPPRPHILKTVGFWIAALMGVLQALNAVRAFAAPVTFADYMGLPLEHTSDVGFVYVYGLRAAFIAILVVLFLGLRRFDALAWTAVAALIMPVGDLLLAHNAGAPLATVSRHAAIAVYVLAAFFVLRRTAASELRR
ncbi:MAG: DUF4267 domain-containing protein [Pseudomonadota bacterium]